MGSVNCIKSSYTVLWEEWRAHSPDTRKRIESIAEGYIKNEIIKEADKHKRKVVMLVYSDFQRVLSQESGIDVLVKEGFAMVDKPIHSELLDDDDGKTNA